MLVAAGVAVAIAARFHDGPIGPFPGGPLAGAVETGPEPDWSFLGFQREVDLQVNRDAPRSVRTWVIVHEGVGYIPSVIAASKRWPGQVEADGRVVLRVNGRLYERRAVRVTDPALRAVLLENLAVKYGDFGLDGSGTWFFRLDPPA